MKLILGDSVDKLKELDDNSIDSIVTDPPYGLSFMGKKWDYDVPSQEIWEECLRVLKPGGYLLSFAGSRTYHRMAVRIEDAGFEIRDQIMWLYGSGFPKSQNIGKRIDKIQGNEREVVGKSKWANRTPNDVPGLRGNHYEKSHDITLPTSDDAKKWEGWGTALKPAHEPIVMARKPLSEKTVVNNVLEWGTGGINIDDSRISTNDTLGGGATNGSVLAIDGFDRPWMHDEEKMKEFSDKMKEKVEYAQTLGRFPANIILDKEAGKILDKQSGVSQTTTKTGFTNPKEQDDFFKGLKNEVTVRHNDKGGASRFFYCPKTSKKDRNEGVDNNHPTVKPTDLMLYLIRLVTPKGGTTLDPFMGSGSSGKAATRGGFDFVGIEREEEYMEIAKARIQYEIDNPYNEETKTRTEVNKEVKEKVNKFFTF
jgi:site-specific DNA-methyltransferase (adenine-specific)